MQVQSRAQVIDRLLKHLEDEQGDNSNSTAQKQSSQREQRNIVLRRTNFRSFRCSHHVYKLFNTFGINQNALVVPDYEQSFFRTYFYHRTVTKVEKYSNAVVISIVPTCEQLCQPPVGYLIDKLKAMGRREMVEVAETLQELWAMLVDLKNRKMESVVREDKESITKYLHLYGEQMFICKFGLYKMAISNSLLRYLGYDVDEFAVETVKYRTVLFDFLSSNSYYAIISHALKTLKYLMQLDLSRITEQQYLHLSTFPFSDYLYGKNNRKTYCDFEYLIPARGVLAIKVARVRSISDELSWKPYGHSSREGRQLKRAVNQKEFALLNRLGLIPSNWLEKSHLQTANYITKEP